MGVCPLDSGLILRSAPFGLFRGAVCAPFAPTFRRLRYDHVTLWPREMPFGPVRHLGLLGFPSPITMSYRQPSSFYLFALLASGGLTNPAELQAGSTDQHPRAVTRLSQALMHARNLLVFTIVLTRPSASTTPIAAAEEGGHTPVAWCPIGSHEHLPSGIQQRRDSIPDLLPFPTSIYAGWERRPVDP